MYLLYDMTVLCKTMLLKFSLNFTCGNVNLETIVIALCAKFLFCFKFVSLFFLALFSYVSVCETDNQTFFLKLQREREKAKKESKKDRKKEKKREKKDKEKKDKEKKEKDKAKSHGDVESKKHSHKKKRKHERNEVDKIAGDLKKRAENEAEQLEKSSLTEEHGNPVGFQNSPDSTLNSCKRQKLSTQSDATHNPGECICVYYPLCGKAVSCWVCCLLLMGTDVMMFFLQIVIMNLKEALFGSSCLSKGIKIPKWLSHPARNSLPISRKELVVSLCAKNILCQDPP